MRISKYFRIIRTLYSLPSKYQENLNITINPIFNSQILIDWIFNFQATFDTGFDTDHPLSKAQLDHLRLLHCDCQYEWLRAFLRKYPYLIEPRRAGEVHRFGGIISDAFKLRDIFVPVDCAKPGLVGDETQTEFSINTNCPAETDRLNEGWAATWKCPLSETFVF